MHIVQAIASFLMAVLTTHGGACRDGVPVGYIKTATETHVPVVNFFCLILLTSGC